MKQAGPKGWAQRRAAVVRAACALALVLAAVPVFAFGAASVDAASIRTVAQVQTDGALHGVEQRTFDFDQSRSVLVWQMTSMEEDSALEVRSARFAHSTMQGGIDGEWTTLMPASFTSEIRDAVEATSGLSASVAAQSASRSGGAEGTEAMDPLPAGPSFCVDSREDAVYFFFPPTEGRVVFECDYLITNAVRAFDDTAELYWDYAPADEDASATSVNVTVQLPMPEGMEAVVGENVYAWGHGAQGTVNVKADGTVIYHVSQMERGQYAQAHILFPQQWLTNLSVEARRAYSGTRLDAAKAEEESWTDTWSAWLANSLGVDLAFVIFGALALCAAVGLYVAYGRERGPQAGADGGALCRSYEAPLIGRLLRWNHESSQDIVALFMQLVARHAIKAEVLPAPGPLGAGYCDMRLRTGARAKDLARTPIDQEALRLLFDVWGEGYASVTLSDIARHAQVDKQAFRQELASFANVLSAEVQDAGFFDAKSARVQRAIIIAGCVLCAGTLFFGVAAGSFVRGCALMIAGIGCLIVGNYVGRRTQRGAQVEASALALADALEAAPGLASISEDDAPYAFALDAVPEQSASGGAEGVGGPASPGSFAVLWLAPRTGRGGKPVPSLAARLAQALEQWG